MRPFLLVALLLALLLALPAGADDKGGRKYQIDDESLRVVGPYKKDDRFVYDVTFKIKRAGAVPVEEGARDTVVILENNKEAYRFPLKQARAKDLTAVLVMDVSGSMARKSNSGKTKMAEAKAAAQVFLTRLPVRADTGLILFDHTIKLAEKPALDPARAAAHRKKVGELIDKAEPDGGTAYLDAVYEALEMLRDVRGNRAVVLMTDGVDVNSKRRAAQVIRRANELKIPVYVLGVGDPGWSEPLSTVLVLDHSASMGAKAGTGADEKTKIEALHDAASRFVDLMRPGARATLLPFSSVPENPQPFTENHALLKARIQELTPSGGTSLYDATLEGIETVVAGRNPGKRYVVALTDGVDEDPGSRRDPDEVIARAKQAGVVVYMLGLGRKEEVNEAVMRRMAEATGGKYFHAENQKKLFEIFESLSIDIHGDGIDEKALRELAAKTKGKYYRAADASELSLIYQGLAEELKAEYSVTFPSLNQSGDGTTRAIDIYVEREVGGKTTIMSEVVKDGEVIGTTAKRDNYVAGVVVPDFDDWVYLGLLGLLLGLLALPAALRRLGGPV